MKVLTDDVDYIEFIGKQESQFIIKPPDVRDDILARLNGQVIANGDRLPWTKTHRHIRFRPGEVSLWGGYTGHGKSQLLGQVCAWGLLKSKWLIASLEMTPAATIERMVKQISGRGDVSESHANNFINWTNGRLWVYDQTDTVDAERLIGLTWYASSVGINHVVLDCLIKCGVGREDYEAQANFVDRLCWSAKTNKIHIHIVHHMRKGERGDMEYSKVPCKHDFRGAGEITDLVDNVFIVHRNKKKELMKQQNDKRYNHEEPDCKLKCDKQRHGEWEGIYNLWFDESSRQYTAQQGKTAHLAFTEENERYE